MSPRRLDQVEQVGGGLDLVGSGRDGHDSIPEMRTDELASSSHLYETGAETGISAQVVGACVAFGGVFA